MKSKIVIETKWLKAFADLSPKLRLEMYDAIFNYTIMGIEPKLSSILQVLFQVIKVEIDKRTAIEKARSQAGKNHIGNQYSNKQNGTKRNKTEQIGTKWDKLEQIETKQNTPCKAASIKEENKTLTDKKQKSPQINNNNNNIYIDNNKEDSNSLLCLKKDSKGKNFTKPTITEIRDYVFEKNYHVDPEKFFNWYESNGWKVGKNPMKNWHSAVTLWERNEYDKRQKNNHASLSPELRQQVNQFMFGSTIN